MPPRINTKALRASMGLSIDGLAEKIGVHGRTISRWENGHTDPSPLAVARLRELQQADAQGQPGSGSPRRRPFERPASEQGS